MREYSEELLGAEDAQGRGGVTIDYDCAEPYRTLNTSVQNGRLAVNAFGIVLDPLTLKPELLTVAVFDGQAFDELFGQMVRETDEGVIIRDVPFNESEVKEYATKRSVRLGARALLELAWSHRG
jgi:hypothetical protein